MAENWVKATKDDLFTKISYYGKKAFQKKYPNIVFTRSRQSNVTQFPTVFIQFLDGGAEIGSTIDGKDWNGFSCDIEIQVTTNKTQDFTVAEEIAYGLIDIIHSRWMFRVSTQPIDTSLGADTHTQTFRMTRIIGNADLIE